MRSDLRHAIGTAAFVNTQVAKKRDAKQPKDFMAGEWLRKAYEKSAVKRGVKKAWDGKKWWGQFKAHVSKKG